MKNLGKLIKLARERRNYTTQIAAAEAAGMSLTSYNRLENGVTKEMPAPDVLRRIEDVFGVSMRDMLTAAGYLRQDEDEGALPAEDRAFLDGLAHYLPQLGEAQRRHVIETARMFAEAAAARQAQTPGASAPADRSATRTHLDHQIR